MKIDLTVKKEFDVGYVKFAVCPRNLEDATINGVEAAESEEIMPGLDGDIWTCYIEVETGKIKDWPQGTTASVFYKVCDAGVYSILDKGFNVISETGEEYVPDFICSSGYGDYIDIDIDENGYIENWKVSSDELSEYFEKYGFKE